MVFSLLVQHCQQEAASTKLVSSKSLLLSLSKLMDMKTSLGSHPVANLLVSSDHCTGLLTLVGQRRSSASPSWASSSSPPFF